MTACNLEFVQEKKGMAMYINSKYETVFDRVSDLAAKGLFAVYMLGIAWAVITNTPADLAVMLPVLLLACFLGAIVWLLIGFIPTFIVGVLVGGLSAATIFIKDKIKSRTANGTALKF